MQGEPEWFFTEPAAFKLGISAEQLRKLRRKGLFKNGHHYRDISVPGSGLPRWQWHVERCVKALEIPPEKRSIRKG
ncbi:DNA-binding protein [Cyanobacteria bacterium FACHB-471]|nr:DNA-binding protein [Cyanobacteria bacterium FACHB-471]